MEEYFDEGFADVEEGGIFHYGQTTDAFGKTEQSLDFYDPLMVAQNNVDSYATMAKPEAPVPQATLIANTSVPNQDFYDPFMVAQNNVDSYATMAQSGAPVPQATLVANTSMPNQGTSQPKAAKRERDKAYRERKKKRKIETEDNLEKCTQENKALKDEVRALKDEVKASKAGDTGLNQALQSRGEEMAKLERDLNQLKHENNMQMVLVQALSLVLAGSDPSPRDEEIQKLKNEIDKLGQGMGVDSPCLELMKENAKLKYELEKVKQDNRALKVQLDAVCEKIIAENPSP